MIQLEVQCLWANPVIYGVVRCGRFPVADPNPGAGQESRHPGTTGGQPARGGRGRGRHAAFGVEPQEDGVPRERREAARPAEVRPSNPRRVEDAPEVAAVGRPRVGGHAALDFEVVEPGFQSRVRRGSGGTPHLPSCGPYTVRLERARRV